MRLGAACAGRGLREGGQESVPSPFNAALRRRAGPLRGAGPRQVKEGRDGTTERPSHPEAKGDWGRVMGEVR